MATTNTNVAGISNANMYLLILCLFISLSAHASAENITVYAKDQNGDDVVKNSHLFGNLTIELWYEGKKEAFDNFNKTQDNLVFKDLTHTGLYTVRAIATIQHNDTEYCYVGEYAPILGDREKCEDLCPGHEFQCDTGTDTCDYTRKNKGDASDDKGTYICAITEWFTSVPESTYSFRFDKVYRYTQMNEVLTHVEEGENDVAEVALFTSKEKLAQLGKNILELDKVSGKLDPQPVYDFSDIPLSAGQEGIEQVIDEAIKQANSGDQAFLKYIFKGAYRSAIATEAASTIVVLGLEGLADPDSLEVNSKNWGYIGVGIVASAIAEKAIASYVLAGAVEGSMVALTAPVAIGVVVAIPVGAALGFTIHEEHEDHLCEHALSDDVYAFIGDPIFGCNPECYGKAAYGKCCYADECFDYSLELVNLGEPLSRVSVGRDPDGGSLACICHNVKSPEKDLATDDAYSENVRFSFFSGAGTCSFSSDYTEYSKLWMNIEVLVQPIK